MAHDYGTNLDEIELCETSRGVYATAPLINNSTGVKFAVLDDRGRVGRVEWLLPAYKPAFTQAALEWARAEGALKDQKDEVVLGEFARHIVMEAEADETGI